MHEDAENGESSHYNYKKYNEESPLNLKTEKENPLNKVFVLDDISDYKSEEDDDGIHFARKFADRHISNISVPNH